MSAVDGLVNIAGALMYLLFAEWSRHDQYLVGMWHGFAIALTAPVVWAVLVWLVVR